jgi:UDP-N-acetylmuramate--alanine ligase
MNIYFSGINGTGIGPLALLAADAGFKVFGSDLARGAVYGDILESGAEFEIGEQNGDFLQKMHSKHGIDWFVYTSALPADHPELVLAQQLSIKTTKRDDLINLIIKQKNLKLIAVAGTHGKTTTTGMIAWVFQQLGLPLCYVVGTTLPFAPSGKFDPNAKYIAYECDEYDRNFLKFHPDLAIITTVDYDHPDIYPTREDYDAAFKRFESQSKVVVAYDTDIADRDGLKTLDLVDKAAASRRINELNIIGRHDREDAYLVLTALENHLRLDRSEIAKALDSFPGTSRRFEKLADGLHTDYAHHPAEIAAVIKKAREVSDKVAVIYQPHQNTRQHQVKDGYKQAFKHADRLFWLPTYLTREDPDLPIIAPEEFIAMLADPKIAEPAELDSELIARAKDLRAKGYLVVLMTAGPADDWLRQHAAEIAE